MIKTKQKIQLLLIFSYILVGGLFAIQYYLIKNTYILQKDNFVKEIKKTVNKIDIDELEKENNDSVYNSFLKIYVNDAISKEDVKLEKFYKVKDSINAKNTIILQKKLDSIFPKYKIKYKLEVIEYVLQLNENIDTLLSIKDKPMLIFGSNIDTDHAFFIDFGTITINKVKTENNELTSNYEKISTQLKSNTYIDISDWKMEVLKRMFSILLLSFILIFSTIFLFFILYKRMLQQKKISEVQTDFANNITHELKTPLASLALIIKSLEIKEVYNSPEKVQELTSTLKRQNLRLQNVVDNVIESSISNEEISLNLCNIKEFLLHYLESVNTNNHQLKISISEENVILETNTTRLENVLNNLIENAIKYSSENSEIEIVSSFNEKYYVIEIKDKGIGISKDNLNKIFDKFYRVSERNIHTTKGLGLGLYLCKMVVSKLGGKLSVESILGKGSVFRIELPISKN